MLFRPLILLFAVLAAASVGCVSRGSATAVVRPFDFGRDTFNYTNQLVWAYSINPETKEQSWHLQNKSPEYSHHCFVMVRSARQFWWHARFDPSLPAVDEKSNRRLVEEVVRRRDSRGSPEEQKVVIPGYAGLREFSAAYPKLLQEECGGAWQSYLQRGHWRMILPFSRNGQEANAHRLRERIEGGTPCVVHLVRFPSLKINHAVLLHAVRHEPGKLVFNSYDSNDPSQPLELVYLERERRFEFPLTGYFAGGEVKVYEIYRNWIY
jgi:hypothetical protein